jgi:hypothetical protein
MILSDVKKFPIVLIAPPRSGSSVICSQIGLDFNLRFFNDITYSTIENTKEEFLDFIQNTDQYVIKFHAFDINKYPSWLIDNIYKGSTHNIKVTRNNQLLHLASIYIARKRKLYHYDRVNLNDYYDPIEIDRRYIVKCFIELKKTVLELNSLPIPFDTIINYEDYQYEDYACVKTPLPSNYNDLLAEIKKLLPILT